MSATDVKYNSSRREDLKRLYELTEGVCRLTSKNSTNEDKGTGFLVGPNVIMTCNHVIPDEKIALNYEAHFYHRQILTPQGEGRKTRSFHYTTIELDPNTLFVSSPGEFPVSDKGLDYTIVALKTDSILKEHNIFALFNKPSIYPGMTTYLFQHPHVIDPTSRLVGDFKQASGNARKSGDNEYEIHYGTPTACGSSGGAVVDPQGNLLALHYRGEIKKCSHTFSNAKDFPFCNAGVSISKILESMSEEDLEKIKKHCPEATSKPQDDDLSLLESPNVLFDSDIQAEVDLANEYAEDAYQAIKDYLSNKVSGESLKKKMKTAFESYEEIIENYKDKEHVIKEIKRQIELLKIEWRKILFFYGRLHCIQRDLQDKRIKQVEGKTRNQKFLEKSLKTHSEYISKNWPKFKKDLEINDNIEERLFLVAILNELLEKPQEAIKKYFQLAEYHSLASNDETNIIRKPLMQSCISKAQSLETREERLQKERLIHKAFVDTLKTIRSRFSYDTFSCFLSYDVSKETEKWIKDFLYRDLITLGIRPVARFLSQKSGRHEVDYSKKIRNADFTFVLCNPSMKQKYEEYRRKVSIHYQLGIEMEFLKDRYQSGKDLDHTFHLQMKGGWKEISFENLPDFFQRKNLVNFREVSSNPYSKQIIYFKESIKLFCDILNIPENEKDNLVTSLTKEIEAIEHRPYDSEKDGPHVEKFLKTLETIPPLPLTTDQSKAQLIGVPNMGKNFQPRAICPLETLFKNSNRRVLTQDPSLICGVGKTFLASHYPKEHGNKYSYVFWIEGKAQETIKNSIDSIIERVQKKFSNVKDFPSLKKWIEATPGILLIFDGVSSPEVIDPYLPETSSSTQILITSRCPKWPEEWEVTSLTLMTPEEGKNLLGRLTGKFESAVEKLVTDLAGIPSLIDQAGRLLKETNDGPHLYPTIIESQQATHKRLLALRGNVFAPQYFAGRKIYLAAIHETLSSSVTTTCVLEGSPCIGKTTIAQQYAFDYADCFSLIWHLPNKDLKASALALASHLWIDIKEKMDLSDLLKVIYQKIESQEDKTLLIFSHLSTEQKVLLPANPKINVLVTANEWKGPEKVLKVFPFSKNETLNLLEKVEKSIEREAAHLIADKREDLFDNNPLALILAAKMISKSDPKSFLKELEAQKSTLKNLFGALWKEAEKCFATLPSMKGEKELASIAKLCALNPQVSKAKLEAYLKTVLKKDNLDPETDPLHIVLRDLLTSLNRFSLVEHEKEHVTMHPLIAEGIKGTMSQEEQGLYLSFIK